MRTAVLITLAAISFASCKKNRFCECTNANGTYIAGEIEATRMQAKKHCKSLSEGATECYLKK